MDGLSKFANGPIPRSMSTMNISLPDALKAYVDQQVGARGYGTSSEFIRDLIRKDQETQKLRNLLLDGAKSPQLTTANDAYFNGLRAQIRHHSST